MSKSQLRTSAGVLILFAILWSDPTMRVIFVGAGFLALISSYFVRAASSTPPAITRLPTRYEQRKRWGLGLGLALSWFGPIPFIYFRRR